MMALCKGSDRTMNPGTDFTKNTGYDVIVIDIRRNRQRTIMVVTIGNSTARERGKTPATKLNWQTIINQGRGSMVLMGDNNAHSQRWDPTCKEQSEATYWIFVTHKHKLVIGCDVNPTYYWKQNNSEGKSIIDLALTN